MNQDNNIKKDVSQINKDSESPVQDEASWAESAKEELEDFIESQGVYLRQ